MSTYIVYNFCNLLEHSYPNLKSVKELIYKRGYGKLNHQRTALTDNSIIEQVGLWLYFATWSVWLQLHFYVMLLLICPYDHRPWGNMASSALKILFTRSWQLVLILRRPTTSSGPSNWRHHLVVWRRRGTITLKEEMLEIAKISSMSS